MEAGKNLVDKVLGEFRDLYDQYCSKASGKVGMREYEAGYIPVDSQRAIEIIIRLKEVFNLNGH